MLLQWMVLTVRAFHERSDCPTLLVGRDGTRSLLFDGTKGAFLEYPPSSRRLMGLDPCMAGCKPTCQRRDKKRYKPVTFPSRGGSTGPSMSTLACSPGSSLHPVSVGMSGSDSAVRCPSELVLSVQALRFRVLDMETELAGSEEAVHLLRSRVVELEMQVEAGRRELERQRQVSAMLQSRLLLATDSSPEDDLRRGPKSHCGGPIVLAASRADVPALRQSIRSAGGPARVDEMNAALMWACWQGSLESATLLIDGGADFRAEHDSALIWACRSGSCDVVRELLRRGADPNALDGCPLRVAAVSGSRAVFEALLEGGAARQWDQ